MAKALKIPKHWPVQDPKQYKPLDWFIPYGNNPRTHPPGQILLLAALIKEHGPDQPIVVDENRIILKGHGRRLAALEAGLEHFIFIQRTGLSLAEKAAMRIADNQVSLLSGWDRGLIVGEIASLKTSGYNIGLLGFGEAQLVSFETVPGPPAGGFQTFGENIPTEFCCPQCKFSWSGNPKPDAVTPTKPAEKSTRKQRQAAAK